MAAVCALASGEDALLGGDCFGGRVYKSRERPFFVRQGWPLFWREVDLLDGQCQRLHQPSRKLSGDVTKAPSLARGLQRKKGYELFVVVRVGS
jgi:hypothetical protein